MKTIQQAIEANCTEHLGDKGFMIYFSSIRQLVWGPDTPGVPPSYVLIPVLMYAGHAGLLTDVEFEQLTALGQRAVDNYAVKFACPNLVTNLRHFLK